MHTVFRSLALILCLALSNVVLAYDEADVYQIEVIFFEHTDSKRFDTEMWPKYVGKLDTRNAVSLSKLKGGVPESLDTLETLDALEEVGDEPTKKLIPKTIALVEPNKILLKDEINKIKNSKNQRFIQHMAWTQPLAANVKSTPIYIQGGKNDQEVQAIIDVKPSGNIYNVKVDLIYNTDVSNRQGVREFKINKDFKVKRKEIFYVDHPVVGMLIVVTPLVVEQ